MLGAIGQLQRIPLKFMLKPNSEGFLLGSGNLQMPFGSCPRSKVDSQPKCTNGKGFMVSPYVMIRGHIFKSEEKQPFIPSGVSIYGAVEYDFERDRLRCHECGLWFASLAAHLGHGAHEIGVREYKIKHGLRLMASLVSREGSRVRSVTSRANKTGESLAINRSRNPRQAPVRIHGERRNEEGKCAAQLSFRIHSMAKQLGRTPTTVELRVAGMGISIILRSFQEKSLGDVMEKIGLAPRSQGERPEIEWI